MFASAYKYRLAISPDQLGAEDSDGPTNKPWQDVVRDRLDHHPFPIKPRHPRPS